VKHDAYLWLFRFDVVTIAINICTTQALFAFIHDYFRNGYDSHKNGVFIDPSPNIDIPRITDKLSNVMDLLWTFKKIRIYL